MSALVRALRFKHLVGINVRTLANGSDFRKVPRYLDEWKAQEKAREGEILRALKGEPRLDALDLLPVHTDFLIVGGGVIGSSIAYWIRKKVGRGTHVTILEKDISYQKCATTRSAGGIRQQFSLEENIQLSMFGAQFLSEYKEYLGEDCPDICFNPEGYLFLADTDEAASRMEENFMLQKKLGARVRLYSKDMLKAQFPFLNVEDVTLASYGLQNEGWFDPWSLLQGLKQWNVNNEIGYLHGELVDVMYENKIIDEYSDVDVCNDAIFRLHDGTLRKITFYVMVIAAGAESGHVGRIVGIGEKPRILSVPIPVEPRKRSVFSFHAPDAPIVGFPFLVEPSGAYVRREGLGGHFICGKSPSVEEEDLNDTDINTVNETYFNEVIWPTLAKKVPAFENIKLQHSWSGCYDYNYMDENAIIGNHPYFRNICMCTGFSGHGLQMAPGAGRAMAELLLDGSYQTIDLSRFGFDRIVQGEPLMERGIV